MPNRLAILIPTHNAPHGLNIILSGLVQRFDRSTIHVVDSSEQRNEVWADRGIHYRHFPSYSISQKLTTALREIPSEYVVLHPDEDFLNYNAIARVSDGMQGAGFSSVLALNLTLRLGRNGPQVHLRNFAWFDEMARTIRGGRVPWHLINSPYYQMIWGTHRTKYLLDFFEHSQQIDWLCDNRAHVVIYERLFNVFMAAKAPVFVCDTPTFIRKDPAGKWKNSLRLDEWLNFYNLGQTDQLRFIRNVTEVFAPAFGLSPDQLEQLLIESLAVDVAKLQCIRTGLNVKKKIFNLIGRSSQIVRVPTLDGRGHVNVKRSGHEISGRRFQQLLSSQIKPFLDLQGPNLVTVWRQTANEHGATKAAELTK